MAQSILAMAMSLDRGFYFGGQGHLRMEGKVQSMEEREREENHVNDVAGGRKARSEVKGLSSSWGRRVV